MNTLNTLEKEMAFRKYMEFTPSIENVDKRSNGLCLRWSPSDEIDKTHTGGEKTSFENILESEE